MLAMQAESPASMRGHRGGFSGATKASVRVEFGEDGWVPCGSKALLYWFYWKAP